MSANSTGMLNRQRRMNRSSHHHTVVAACSCFVFVFRVSVVVLCSFSRVRVTTVVIQYIVVLQYYFNTAVGTPKYPIDVLITVLVLVEVIELRYC